MISCIRCGWKAARIEGDGLHCSQCGHRWTFQIEQDNALYIRRALRREPVLPPSVPIDLDEPKQEMRRIVEPMPGYSDVLDDNGDDESAYALAGDLDVLTVVELRLEADRLGLNLPSRLTKAEIIAAIREANGEE